MGSLIFFLLDTNAVIYLHKGLLKHPLPPGRMAISFVTEIERFSCDEYPPDRLRRMSSSWSDTVMPAS